jgi:hypothetical protein
VRLQVGGGDSPAAFLFPARFRVGAAIPFSALRRDPQALASVFRGGRIMALTIEAIYENGVLKPAQQFLPETDS